LSLPAENNLPGRRRRSIKCHASIYLSLLSLSANRSRRGLFCEADETRPAIDKELNVSGRSLPPCTSSDPLPALPLQRLAGCFPLCAAPQYRPPHSAAGRPSFLVPATGYLVIHLLYQTHIYVVIGSRFRPVSTILPGGARPMQSAAHPRCIMAPSAPFVCLKHVRSYWLTHPTARSTYSSRISASPAGAKNQISTSSSRPNPSDREKKVCGLCFCRLPCPSPVPMHHYPSSAHHHHHHPRTRCTLDQAPCP